MLSYVGSDFSKDAVVPSIPLYFRNRSAGAKFSKSAETMHKHTAKHSFMIFAISCIYCLQLPYSHQSCYTRIGDTFGVELHSISFPESRTVSTFDTHILWRQLDGSREVQQLVANKVR